MIRGTHFTWMAMLVAVGLIGCPSASDDDDAYYEGDDDDDGQYWGDDDDDDDDDTTEEEEEDVCDEATEEETTLYLSADDSNSQAAPTLARQVIGQGGLLHGGMRPYEFLNYYDFYFPAAPAGEVRLVPELRDNGEGSYTMMVAVVAPSTHEFGRRPRSLTFSVDSSGSMSGHPMDMVKEVMTQAANNLIEGDVISILSWDTGTTVLLNAHEVSGPGDPSVIGAINALSTGGSTDLDNGLEKAYELAQDAYDPSRLNRVILLSDGGANTGVTLENMIAHHADDAEAEGIYMVGVGMDDYGSSYDDKLMDTITDAGKGAYVYIDTEEEAARTFGDDQTFLTVMEIAAREVQLSMTMPGAFVMDEFHGEEYSEDPEEVEPQHLAPGDAMLYHFDLMDCAAELHDGAEVFEFAVTWIDPATREERVTSLNMSVDEMIDEAGPQLHKANLVVEYAQALTGVWDLPADERGPFLDALNARVDEAYVDSGDADLAEIADLLGKYKQNGN
ncbi:MAG: VWA domain-containing protein [Myxococcota bacterium]|nr:VWA domain-containing protein [Myxococcota bacterium]